MMHPTIKVGDVATFIRGITFKPDDVVGLDVDDAVVCMRTKNVQALLDTDDLLAVPARFVRRDDQYLEEGDVLVSSANSWNLVGKCCWIPALPWSAAFGGFVSVLRGDSAKVDRRYLYWWFASTRIQALLRSFGQKTTNISNLNIERCLQLDLPLPPLPDQRRIAAILDKAEALRTKRREALAQLDRLAQAIFVKMFGGLESDSKNWPTLTMEGVAHKITDGEHQTPLRREHGIKLLSARNVRDGFLDFDDVDYVGEEEYLRISKRCNPEFGDILISCSGSIGRVARVETRERLALVRSTALVKPNRKMVTSCFLETWLRTPFMNRLMVNSAKSSSQANLFQGPIRALPILVPPMDLQSEFDSQVDAVGRAKRSYQHAVERHDELFMALQHHGFRGAL